MATILTLGPADHGKRLTYADYMTGDYDEGYQYEIISGRLYVSPHPEVAADILEKWLWWKLWRFSRKRPATLKYVTNKARVIVAPHTSATVLGPDLTAYRHLPLHRPLAEWRWEDIHPILVVEVVAGVDPDVDLVRNVALYLQVPSIKEYWVIDAREDPELPTMKVRRRRGKKWNVIDLEPGDAYTTKLLQGFRLVIDPRK